VSSGPLSGPRGAPPAAPPANPAGAAQRSGAAGGTEDTGFASYLASDAAKHDADAAAHDSERARRGQAANAATPLAAPMFAPIAHDVSLAAARAPNDPDSGPSKQGLPVVAGAFEGALALPVASGNVASLASDPTEGTTADAATLAARLGDAALAAIGGPPAHGVATATPTTSHAALGAEGSGVAASQVSSAATPASLAVSVPQVLSAGAQKGPAAHEVAASASRSSTSASTAGTSASTAAPTAATPAAPNQAPVAAPPSVATPPWGQRSAGPSDFAASSKPSRTGASSGVARAGAREGTSGATSPAGHALKARTQVSATEDPTDGSDADGAPKDDAAIAGVAALAGAPATPSAQGSAKPLAVVTEPSALPVDGALAGARLRDALASVANHAVLRNAASGEIDVPELGRVAVRAHTVGGAVDVDITADRPDARAALRLHSGAITNDLREADVRVSRLTIEASHGGPTDATASDGSSGASSRRNNDSPAHDSSRDGEEGGAHDPEPVARPMGRVRIVL